MSPISEVGSSTAFAGSAVAGTSACRPFHRAHGRLWWALCLAVCGLFLKLAAEPGLIIMNIPGIAGDSITIGPSFTSTAYLKVASVDFGVDRTLSDAAKAGTADINLGVGLLSVVKLTKGLDQGSAFLMRKAISGSSIGTVKIYFIGFHDVGGTSTPYVYLAFALDNAFSKSWSTAGDGSATPTETSELWFNKISMQVAGLKPDGTVVDFQKGEWDNTQAKPWADAPDLIPAGGGLPPSVP